MEVVVIKASVNVAKNNSRYVRFIGKNDQGTYTFQVWACADCTQYWFKEVSLDLNSLKEFQGIYSGTPDQFHVHANVSSELQKFIPSVPSLDEFLSVFSYTPSLQSLATPMYKLYTNRVAASNHHHAYPGGLIKHTYEIGKLFQDMLPDLLKFYGDFSVEAVYLAILCHDYGKCQEYNLDGSVNSDVMNTMGHVFLGANFVSGLNGKFSKNVVDKAVHAVLAHHEFKEWGSPVEPASVEAVVLAALDRVSGRCTELNNC